MTGPQRAFLLSSLFKSNLTDIESYVRTIAVDFGLSEAERIVQTENIIRIFNDGIKNLNNNQFDNILNKVKETGFDEASIRKKLDFYGIDEEYHQNILRFFDDSFLADRPIDVDNLEMDFRGVQVATRDNFNTIINNGYTGDWDLQPNNIDPRRIQIASMNENGPYPRGCYINADIDRIDPILQPDGSLRYRIFITNPLIVNTGKRNVKFIAQPVRYM